MNNDKHQMLKRQKIACRQKLQRELHRQLRFRRKVYLDINYWVWFNNARHGRHHDPAVVELYELFETLVKEKVIVCPVTQNLYYELMKQAGQPEFHELVELMEHFSDNVVFVTKDEIVFQEFKASFVSYINQKNKRDIGEIFWSRPYDLMGHSLPSLKHLAQTSSQELVLYNSYLRFVWNKSLSYIISASGAEDNGPAFKNIDPTGVDRLNTNNELHRSEITSFDGLYQTEREGNLTAYKGIAWMAFKDAIVECDASFPNEINEFERLMHRVVEVNGQPPGFMEVTAGIHVVVRWEQRKYDGPNDLFDYSHAFFAVPYFDYFFTERKLANLLKHQRLRLEQKFDCAIESKIKAVTARLRPLL